MQIVTSDRDHIDIDGLACIAAYAELLQLQGREAAGVSTGAWNASITPLIRSWNIHVTAGYTPQESDHFTLVDVTNPRHLDEIVKIEQVSEIIDHHPGYEAFWHEKIGEKAQIEEIGAASTMVAERWQDAGLMDRISQTSARLLMSGILDNTLNFKAKITKQRDRDMYEQLRPLADLPENWPEQYFNDCQAHIIQDVKQAILEDTKTLTFPNWDGEVEFGQIVIWDATAVLKDPAIIRSTLQPRNPVWCMNLPSISEGASYFICENAELKHWLEAMLDLTFEGNTARASRLWLRKEIARQVVTRYTKNKRREAA